jgi:hypothetical protein
MFVHISVGRACRCPGPVHHRRFGAIKLLPRKSKPFLDAPSRRRYFLAGLAGGRMQQFLGIGHHGLEIRYQLVFRCNSLGIHLDSPVCR